MKKIFYTIILITSLLSIQPISYLNAQNRPSFGIAPKVEIPAGNRTAGTGAIIPGLLTNTAYICDALSNEFQRIHFGGPGTDSLIGYLTELYHGGEFANGSYYVTNNSNVLKTISLTNAQATTIAPITGIPSGYIVTSLAYKQPGGPMYAGATNGFQSILYTLNLSTAAASLVGTITNCDLLACFAMNCAGELYAIELTDDIVLKINTLTGAGTIIGPFGIDANYDQSCRFDVTTNTLYWFAYNVTLGCGQLRIINLYTGGSTLISTLSGHQITAFGFTAVCPPVPACDMQTGPFISMPEYFLTGNNYDIKAKVKNVGTASQTNIPVKFFVNGVQYGATQTISSLAPGAIDTSRVFVWTPSVNGSTNLKICAALGCDSNRTNDTVATFVTVGLYLMFCDNFTAGAGNWTIANNGGTCVWGVRPQRGYQMPPAAVGNCFSADVDLCGPGTTINSTATLADVMDCTFVVNTYCEFDNDFMILGSDQAKFDLSTNGGTTWINKFTWTTYHRNTHEVVSLPEAYGKPNVKIRFTSIQPGWDWWWAIDNVCIKGSVVNGVPAKNNLPVKYLLTQNYPNPFNPTTVISYQLPKSGNVKLVVFDVLGREVQTLVNEYKAAGRYEVTFNGTSLSSGLYFYRITSGTFTDVKKMLMIK